MIRCVSADAVQAGRYLVIQNRFALFAPRTWSGVVPQSVTQSGYDPRSSRCGVDPTAYRRPLLRPSISSVFQELVVPGGQDDQVGFVPQDFLEDVSQPVTGIGETAADLSGAAMDGANLTKAVLAGCRLDESRLPAATMRQIEGSGASFVRADLSDADLLMSDFSEANFAGANLSSASMRSTVLRGANLTLADLAGADLAGVDLRGSNWWRARGLTADQLDDFAERFRPSAETDPQRAEDFLQWLELGVF